jgi:hypothetical protein
LGEAIYDHRVDPKGVTLLLHVRLASSGNGIVNRAAHEAISGHELDILVVLEDPEVAEAIAPVTVPSRRVSTPHVLISIRSGQRCGMERAPNSFRQDLPDLSEVLKTLGVGVDPPSESDAAPAESAASCRLPLDDIRPLTPGGPTVLHEPSRSVPVAVVLRKRRAGLE